MRAPSPNDPADKADAEEIHFSIEHVKVELEELNGLLKEYLPLMVKHLSNIAGELRLHNIEE